MSGCKPNNGPGGVPFGVYAIAQNFNIPIQVQPQIFMTLCLISWAQTLRYHRYARGFVKLIRETGTEHLVGNGPPGRLPFLRS